jgi:hypothetical protein
MSHPADHPAAALAITRSLPGQLQKAKQAGDVAAATAIEAALARARRIAMPALRAAGNNGARAAPPEPQPIPPQPRPPQPPHPTPSPKPPPPRPPVQHGREDGAGWAEIVVDRRQRQRWR